MENVWILRALLLLAVSFEHSETLTTASRSEHFELHRDVNITCCNVTWNVIIYSIWNISLNGTKCHISNSSSGDEMNNCSDGKMLHNSLRGESYLYIPKFSTKDEGTYICETVYHGGIYLANITVSARASPTLSTWQEWVGDHRVAVCLAANGKPAASVAWEMPWNSSSVSTSSTQNVDGSVTVETRLYMPNHVTVGNLTCVATHPSWTDAHSVTLAVTVRTAVSWLLVLSLVSTCLILAALSTAYLARKHLARVRFCCKSDVSTPTESKPPQPQEEVEEVQPYASYTQRVNSIYNSSAELIA